MRFLLVATATIVGLGLALYKWYNQEQAQHQYRNTNGLGNYEPRRRRSTDKRNEKCTICLEGNGSQWVELRCSHRFHFDCLHGWMHIKQFCPNCRADIDF